MKERLKHIITVVVGLVVAGLIIYRMAIPYKNYYYNDGDVFGTYYSVRYEATKDMKQDIIHALESFNHSMSMFDPSSVLYAINANTLLYADEPICTMFAEAERVNKLSDGAFDITVAPLVNYWGFGRTKKTEHSPSEPKIQSDLDSIRAFVGFEKVKLEQNMIVKSDPRVQIDGGAVAKGQACDMIANLLQQRGVTNYLVDIGGEVVLHGINHKGKKWRVGITKPNLNNEGAQDDFQSIIEANDLCMATSGNYRNYYYSDGERRSHTIDPRTGYPVQHSLLSATVVSSSCMRADALATACMVLGVDKALDMIEQAQDAACYFIVAQKDSLITITSPNWKEFVEK